MAVFMQHQMKWAEVVVCLTAVQMLKTTKTLWETFLHKFMENKTTCYVPVVIYLFIYLLL